MMRHADIEKFCLSLPAATLVVQWGESRVYKVGGKVFALLSPAAEKPATVCFKVGENSFEILTQDPKIVQAPYFAKRKWVSVTRLDALKATEMKAYLARSHALVAAGLSRKIKTALGLPPVSFPAEPFERSETREGKGTQVRQARR
jgi:predicted DNA-binding protein (MmcQ/YjbR family)